MDKSLHVRLMQKTPRQKHKNTPNHDQQLLYVMI